MIALFGTKFIELLNELGGTWLFFKQVLKTFLKTKGNTNAILGQIAFVYFRSFSTVIFAGVFVGAILVLQFNTMLMQYDAQTFLGGLNTSSVVRQVGPLIISFLLAGKIGAYTTAELGTMRVTEQIDAIECLGTNPIQYLIIPRMLGIILAGLVLLAAGLLMSVMGSMLVAKFLCGMNFLQYLQSVPRFIDGWTLLASMIQGAVYCFIVALVSCYKGFTATGGARGVGRAVTLSAIYTNFYIVLANFLTSRLLDMGIDTARNFVRGHVG